MATRRYLNFDLLLEQEGEGRYQARVTDSPLGETPSVRFELPFDATTLESVQEVVANPSNEVKQTYVQLACVPARAAAPSET